MRGRRDVLRGLCTASVVTLLLASSTVVAWADPSRADILRGIGADAVAADYVVLVDTSGSMAADNRYGSVVQSLSGLFDAMSPGDHVSLYTFDNAVTPVYLGPSEPAAGILGKLPAAPNPTGATDLGKAISAALDELERPGAAPVANVLLVTDGAHEPPSDSPYPRASGPAWDALRQRASKFDASVVSAYAVPLGDHASGAALLKSVFSDAVVLDPANVQNLRDYLSRTKGAVELAKARTVLAQDSGKSLDATWKFRPGDDGATEVAVTLTAQTKHVPMSVSGLELTAGDGSVLASVTNSTVEVGPGQSVTVHGSVVYKPSSGLPIYHTQSTTTPITLRANLSSPWAAALQPEIHLGLPDNFTVTSSQITLSRSTGWPWFLPVVLIVLAMLVIGLVLIRLRRRHALSGTLVVRDSDGSAELARFSLTGATTPLDSPALPGHGEVAAVHHGGQPAMRISYSSAPASRPAVSGQCWPGGSVVLGGLFFSHVKVGG